MGSRPDRPARVDLRRAILIVATLACCWWAMQAVHELGHVLGAWMTGGKVARVVLHPLSISRTDLVENPHPLAVAWAGPMVGATFPLLLWALLAAARFPAAFLFLFRFFAGFCLVANGLYLAAGSLQGIGDAGDLLRHGAPPWQLWLFGILTIPLGFWLWHGQGTYFGPGRAQPNARNE
jgi:hypothetical protein